MSWQEICSFMMIIIWLFYNGDFMKEIGLLFGILGTLFTVSTFADCTAIEFNGITTKKLTQNKFSPDAYSLINDLNKKLTQDGFGAFKVDAYFAGDHSTIAAISGPYPLRAQANGSGATVYVALTTPNSVTDTTTGKTTVTTLSVAVSCLP